MLSHPSLHFGLCVIVGEVDLTDGHRSKLILCVVISVITLSSPSGLATGVLGRVVHDHHIGGVIAVVTLLEEIHALLRLAVIRADALDAACIVGSIVTAEVAVHGVTTIDDIARIAGTVILDGEDLFSVTLVEG